MKGARPPRIAIALFSWFCGPAAIEDLEGDLEEIFIRDAARMPAWKAKIRFWKMIISLMFSYSVRKRKRDSAYHPFSSASSIDMFRNYFKVSWRSLAKNRFFTVINVIGLAVGMSISLLFISMISYVSTYDTFHEKRDRIYRVTTLVRDESGVRGHASSPSPLAEKMKAELPAIEKTVRISHTLYGNATTGKKEIPINGYFTDNTFFDVFSFPIIKGNARKVLDKPMSVVLTQAAAQKIFGDEDAFGKQLTIEPWGTFEITGIMKDYPKASHFQFEAIASYNSMINSHQQDEWSDFKNHYTYFLSSGRLKEQELQGYLDKISTEKRSVTTDAPSAVYSFQALNDIAPGPDYANAIGPEWDYTGFTIFGILNLLILIPACFNYANISISRTLKRAKEIGLRKTVGGQRNQIFTQFISETIIVTLIALGGGILIFTQIRGEFLAMLVSADGLELNTDPVTLIYFVIFAIITGLIAGVVPALYFSRLNPVQALKNAASLKSITGFSFQKFLIVSQFALSLGFIMGVVITLRQYRETINYDFGFKQENILDVELHDIDVERFRNKFSQLSSVKLLSMSSGVIGASYPGEATLWRPEGVSDSLRVHQFFADQDYLENLQIKLIAGTTFPATEGPARERFIIVNEEFLGSVGISSEVAALNEIFVLDDSVEVQIAGVVKNFHYTSLREPIRPFIIRNDPTQFRYANLAVSSTDVFEAIEEMETAWKSIGATTPFRARFFRDEIQETYSFYFSMIKICGFLGLLAITISCLGLLGMVVYSTENRMKELGVRKVMGASSYQLAVLLSKGYLKLMLIAALIAIPVTYFIFDKGMLQMQHYRVEIGVGEVVVSLLIMLMLGGATILSQTIKAAGANPADTLKNE